ncbi:hypothetical protein [Streptomyces sp. NPDC055055]
MSRRPARRRSRKADGSDQLLLALLALVIAGVVIAAVVDFVRAYPWVPFVLLLLAGGAAAAWTLTRQRAARGGGCAPRGCGTR